MGGRLQGQPHRPLQRQDIGEALPHLTHHRGLSLCLLLSVSGKMAAFLVLKCLRLADTHISRRCTLSTGGRNHPLPHAGLPTGRLGFQTQGHESSTSGKEPGLQDRADALRAPPGTGTQSAPRAAGTAGAEKPMFIVTGLSPRGW